MIALAIAVSGEVAVDLSLEIREHAQRRSAERLGRSLDVGAFLEFSPTTWVRDGLRQWRNAEGAALMVRESYGHGWGALTVVTVLGPAEVANTETTRVRPYRRVMVPAWLADMDIDVAIARGRLLRAVAAMVEPTAPQLAAAIGCSESHAGTWLGELAAAGLVVKAKSRRRGSTWRLRPRASVMIGIHDELPAVDDVDVLRRQIAEANATCKAAVVEAEALRARVLKHKARATELGAKLAKYIDQEQLNEAAILTGFAEDCVW